MSTGSASTFDGIRRITSPSNPGIRRITELRLKARARRQERCFVIEGERLFADTPEDHLEEIYVTEAFLGSAGQKAAERLSRMPHTLVSEQVMNKISDTKTPQGILCTARMPSFTRGELLRGAAGDCEPLLLVLENIQDPGNLGTMIRTAEAAGVTGVLMSADTADLFSPKAVRSTMSAVFRMPHLYVRDLPAELSALKEEGVAFYAAHLGADTAYDEVSYTGPSGFLVGNEGNGLSEEAAACASRRILIPMSGEIDSLNAAMAAGILVYEAARQRREGAARSALK